MPRLLAESHMSGHHGLNQDVDQALKLHHIAADMGSANSHTSEHGLKFDMKSTKMHAECAVKLNDAEARSYVAHFETKEGNIALATRHYRLGAEARWKDHMDHLCFFFFLQRKDEQG